ncbi:MAG: hypothetical protein WCF64_16800, partial [Methylocella sp.]
RPRTALAVPLRVLGGNNRSGQSWQRRARASDAVSPNPQLPESFVPHHQNLALQRYPPGAVAR